MRTSPPTSMCQLSMSELTWPWWPWGAYATPSGERKWMRHGTGRPVRPSRTRVRTQLRPWSIISMRTRPSALSAEPVLHHVSPAGLAHGLAVLADLHRRRG